MQQVALQAAEMPLLASYRRMQLVLPSFRLAVHRHLGVCLQAAMLVLLASTLGCGLLSQLAKHRLCHSGEFLSVTWLDLHVHTAVSCLHEHDILTAACCMLASG
jgi:hypothetical protein